MRPDFNENTVFSEFGRSADAKDGKAAIPAQLRELAESCWAQEPADRPENFDVIVKLLEGVLVGVGGTSSGAVSVDAKQPEQATQHIYTAPRSEQLHHTL
jgi:hypothetical protein